MENKRNYEQVALKNARQISKMANKRNLKIGDYAIGYRTDTKWRDNDYETVKGIIIYIDNKKAVINNGKYNECFFLNEIV